MYIDELVTKEGGNVGIVWKDPNCRLAYNISLDFSPTNNETKYDVLLCDLQLASQLITTILDILTDLKEMVANQTLGVSTKSSN